MAMTKRAKLMRKAYVALLEAYRQTLTEDHRHEADTKMLRNDTWSLVWQCWLIGVDEDPKWPFAQPQQSEIDASVERERGWNTRKVGR